MANLLVKERDIALDRFRGLAIILMAIVNDLGHGVPGIPRILLHAEDIGLTFADMVAPLFMFAIAATYRQSFLRRAEKDKKGAYTHAITRYLTIIGIGAFFSGVSTLSGELSDWGALQAIGVAGLLALLVVKLPTLVRAAAGFGLLGVYQIVNQFAIGDDILHWDHGGLFGSVSWTALLILATVMIDLYRKGTVPFLIGTGVLAGLGAVSALFWNGVSKNRVSFSYVLVSLAICCALYILLELLTKALPKWKSGLVAWWGENPMLFYIMHLVLIGASQVLFLNVERPLWIAIPSNLALLTLMSLTAWQLHKRKLYISL